MALFVPDVEFSIAETFIEYLRNCYPAVRKQVVRSKCCESALMDQTMMKTKITIMITIIIITILTFIEYLRNCYPAVRKQVVVTNEHLGC